MEGLRVIQGTLRIESNATLGDVTALDGLTHVTGDVTIIDNPLLGDAAAQSLVDAIDQIDGTVTISGNGP